LKELGLPAVSMHADRLTATIQSQRYRNISTAPNLSRLVISERFPQVSSNNHKARSSVPKALSSHAAIAMQQRYFNSGDGDNDASSLH
jgi:hypothetical protein